MKARGKPSHGIAPTEALFSELFERIANGEPLRKICRDDHMPNWTTFYDYINCDDELAQRFARARQLGFDAIAMEALEIADTPLIGTEEEYGPQGTKIKQADMLGHRKLQVETRLKLLAKWDPKRYGELIRQEIGGPDGKPLAVPTFADMYGKPPAAKDDDETGE